MIYNPEYAVVGLVHAFIGVAWMGMHISGEVLILPEIRSAEKLADMPSLRKFPKVSMINTILGLLTLLSGVVFLLVKFGTDPSRLVNDAEPRTVLYALALVLAVMVLGFGFAKPLGEGIGKKAAGLKPMDPLPADFKADTKKLEKLLHAMSALVSAAFAMMILAINGGI